MFAVCQDSAMRQKYLVLKDTNEHLLRQLENGQQQLDQLNVKKEMLDEVSSLFLTIFISLCIPCIFSLEAIQVLTNTFFQGI